MHRKPSETREQSETRRLVLLFIGIAIAFSVAGYLVGNIRLIYLEQEARLFAQQRDSLHQRMQQQEYRSNILQVELDVERAATQALQQELRLTQDENANIRRELTFYQRVMAPELNADGISIDSMTVNALPGTNSFYFRLILLQQERIQQLAQGSLRLTLRGLRDGARQEYSLLTLAGIDEGSTQFVMSYFSLTEGSFTLPENFVPETLHVNVRSRQGRQTERTFQWQQLITAEPEEQEHNAN
ncbi:DUF6776 family protein [Aliidiomarina sp.]|uniref:DUF6776 family protein n=1 Tax=Aliidiomarina sp. TaxID=1872439 RepID=UPI003A4D55E3